MRLALGAAVLALALNGCFGARSADPPTLHIQGSDTMRILIERWAETYMTENPGTSIHTAGGGSATGIRALIAGDVDICAASRPLLAEEVRETGLKARQCGVLGVGGA